VLKRLPLTFLPFVNQQLNQWNYLFPTSASRSRGFSFTSKGCPPSIDRALRLVVELEEKMGVRHWEFSTKEQTILNSSQLARSPYFQEWRQACSRSLTPRINMP